MRPWPRAVYEWGSSCDERDRRLPCDELLPDPGETLLRAIDVRAPSAVVYRWLCQLRVAPYSYDLVDNLGRRSPRELTPGLEQLEVGQHMMFVFRIAAFEPGSSITLYSRGRLIGPVACTYQVDESSPGLSRLLVKVLLGGRGAAGLLAKLVVAPGDLVMMRRQLLNLKRLAEAG